MAGEDDLDAPELAACGQGAAGALDPRRDRFPSRDSGNGRLRGATKSTATVLDTDHSAALRDKLLAEVANLASAESAVTWAARALPAKNSLTAADAKVLEEAFEQKLSSFTSPGVNGSSAGEGGVAPEVTRQEEPQAASAERDDQPSGIDKSVLAVAAPRRYRNREHLRYVAQQPCLICGRKPSDPHHLRYVQPRALGRKASDEFAVPLCRSHHRAVHRAGEERAWWQTTSIDPLKLARKLWKHTRVNEGRIWPDPMARAVTSDRALESSDVVRKTHA